MDIIFMNSGSSKTSDPHRLLLNLSDKINLERSDKYVALTNLSIYYKFNVSAPTWNGEFELINGSYFVSDIQDYFEYIIKKHEIVTDDPSIRIYVNKIENRMTFKIKAGYFLESLTPEKTKLLGSTETNITEDKNGENVPHLEINEVVLVH